MFDNHRGQSRSLKSRKIVGVLVLVSLLLPGILLFLPKTVTAQEVVTVGADVPRGIEKIFTTAANEIEKSFRLAIAKSAMMFSRKVAHNLAVKLARQTKAGTKGGSLDWRDMGQIMQDAGYAAFGEAVGTFSEKFFGDAAFLCDPNPYVRLVIGLALLQSIEPTPKCDGRQVIENYNALSAEWNSGQFLRRFSASFEPTQSDLGTFTEALSKVEQHKADVVQARILDKLWGSSQWFDVSDIISDQRISSRNQIEKFVNATMIEGPAQANQWEALYSLMTGAIASPFVFQFADSFVAEMMQLHLSGLFGNYDLCDANIPGLPKCNPKSGLDGSEWGSGTPRGQYSEQEIQERFASLLTPKIAVGGEYDIVSEFASCPDAQRPSQNTCVIDQSFSEAILNRYTVQEAIDQGVLHGDWSFGYTQAGGLSQPSYDSGYPASSMKKLRKARIIPVGWELAAEIVAGDTTLSGPVTLQQMVNAFNQTGDDKQCNTNDVNESPFCGLVDPDWVLKSPQQKCEANAVSPMLAEATVRQDWCADTRSCIKEKADGSCESWGYCTREANTWWFGGEECPAEYNTCQTFVNKDDNSRGTWLKSSLNYQSCDSTNAGCTWYAQAQNSVGDWVDTPQNPANDYNILALNSIYFDGDAQQCNASAAGCSEFIRSYSGSGTNLVKNGSFEDHYRITNNPTYPDVFYDWTVNLGTVETVDVQFGASAVALNNGGSIRQSVPVGYATSQRTFTLSLYAKDCAADTSVVFGPVSRSLQELAGDGYDPAQLTQWTTYALTYTFPINSSTDSMALTLTPGSGSTACKFDGLQVEEGATPTYYGEYGAVNLAYLKQPPAYLNCNGSPNQPADCSQYAPVCAADQVGCQKYTDLADNTVVPGIIKPEDICPAECSGYSTYKQDASNFYQEKFPLYFIPSTADSCQWEDSGCESFTNLDSVAAGGEGVESYSFLRRCQAPAPTSGDCRPFYTWEGSDSTGYQLKLYTLKMDPASGAAPLTIRQFPGTPQPGDPYSCQTVYGKNPGDPGYDPQLTPGCKEFYFANPTSGPFTPSYTISYRLLADTVLCTEDCHPYRLNSGRGLSLVHYTNNTEITGEQITVGGTYDASQIAFVAPDASCSQSGGLYTQCVPGSSVTIPAASSYCRSQGGSFSNNICYNLNDQSVCTTSVLQGEWQILSAECRYLGTPQESTACTSPGCQTYRGNFSGNRYLLFDDSFEANANGWLTPTPPPAYVIDAPGQLAGESFSVAGHSFTPISTGSITLPNPPGGTLPAMSLARSLMVDSGNGPESLVRQNKAYILSFWAKSQQSGGNNLRVMFDGVLYTSDSPDNYFSHDRSLDTNWQYYRFGPVFVDWAEPNQYLLFSSQDNKKFYLDNVRLEEVTDMEFLVRDSWETPASCDQNQAGAPAPQYMLGCTAYQDVNNQVQYLKSFSNLCEESAIGCEAVIDTRNSAAPREEIYNYICSLSAACVPAPGQTTCDCQYADSDSNTFSACAVAPGETDCKFTLDQPESQTVKESVLGLVPDTALVPADRFTYLVNRPEFSCAAADKGCTAMARPQLDVDNQVIDYLKPNSQDENVLYLRSNPDQYATALCTAPALGCTAYDGGGELNPVYFHDPAERVCEYRAESGTGTFAWFEKGSDTACPDHGDPTSRSYEDPEPLSASLFGYTTWSRSCPANYSSCTQFIDPAGAPGNNIYYYQDDQNLDRTACNGLASQKKGCVLFENDNKIKWAAAQQASWNPADWSPELTYSSAATYARSEASNNAAVSPINCTSSQLAPDEQILCNSVGGGNDANDLLSVRRDRVCAEWISCQRSYQVFDPQINAYRTICLDLDPCTKFGANSTECIQSRQISDPGAIASDSYLSLDKYLQRSRDWSGYEYSGYSIPHLYPVWSLSEYDYGTCSDSDILCLSDSGCPGTQTCDFRDVNYRVSRVNVTGNTLTDLCLGKYDVTGGFSQIGCPLGAISRAGKSCRGYPESDAPFAANTTVGPFSDANHCQAYGDADCDCHYEKLVTGNGVRSYFDYPEATSGGLTVGVPQRICSIADDAHPGMLGKACGDGSGPDNDDRDCIDKEHEPNFLAPEQGSYIGNPFNDGTPSENDVCIRPTGQTTYLGWRGYCLEYDDSIHINGSTKDKACLTWMPIDLASGEPDIYSNKPTAGFAFGSYSTPYEYCAANSGSRGALGYRLDDRPANHVRQDQRVPESADFPDPAYDYIFVDLNCPFFSACNLPGTAYQSGNPTIWLGDKEYGGLGALCGADFCREGFEISSGIRRIPATPREREINQNDLKYIEIIPNNTGPTAGDRLRTPFRLTNELGLGGDWSWGWCGYSGWVDPQSGQESRNYPSANNCTGSSGTNFFYDGEFTGNNIDDIFRNKDHACENFAPFNAFAIQAHFDNNGFLDYWQTGYCDGSQDGSYLDIADVKFIMKETCEETVLVAKSENTDPQNFGNSFFNTNRVWADGGYDFGGQLGFATADPPFGKYGNSTISFAKKIEIGNQQDETTLFGTGFRCLSGDCRTGSTRGSCINNAFDAYPGTGLDFADLDSCDPSLESDPSCDNDSDNPQVYCAGTAGVWNSGSGSDRLQQLFVVSFNYHVWSNGDDKYNVDLAKTWGLPTTSVSVRRSQAQAPKVWAAIFDSIIGDYTTGEPGTVAINGQTRPTDVYYGDSITTVMSFYAANDNGAQMPLRRFLVDWGDGAGAIELPAGLDTTTSYANYKEKCNDTAGNFGDQRDQSCVEAHFEAKNVYTCTASQGSAYQTSCSAYSVTLPGESAPYTGPCCVYTPRVTVVDNWGACANGCSGGACLVLSVSDEDASSSNECYYRSGTKLLLKKATATYPGKIVIIPSSEL